MKKTSNFLAAMLTGFLLGACVACGGSTATAASGVTEAQVQADIAAAVGPLNAQIASLQGQVASVQSEIPHTLLVSTGGSVTTEVSGRRTLSLAPAGSTASTAVGTYMGAGNVIGSSTQMIQSGEGYLAVAPTYPTTNVMLAGVYPIFYDGSDCTGNAYVLPGPNLSLGWLVNGIVVSPSNGTEQDYLYVPAGTGTTDVPFTMASFLNAPGDCETPGAPQPMSAAQLLPNDPNVTGFQNSPIASLTLAP
jgi:hypothetical protein